MEKQVPVTRHQIPKRESTLLLFLINNEDNNNVLRQNLESFKVSLQPHSSSVCRIIFSDGGEGCTTCNDHYYPRTAEKAQPSKQILKLKKKFKMLPSSGTFPDS